MNIRNAIVFVFLIIALFTSCTKKPSSSFTVSETVNYAGKNIDFTNNSKDAYTYSWIYGDATDIENTTNPSHLYSKSGNYDVTLKAYSKNKKKLSESTNAIKVYGGLSYDYNSINWQSDFDGIAMSKYTTASEVAYSNSSTVSLNKGAGYVEFSIGRKVKNNTSTSLTDEDFKKLFTIGNVTKSDTNNRTVILINGGLNYSFFGSTITEDNFVITNTMPYRNGFIVEATFSFGNNLLKVDNGKICFYVEK